MDKRVIFILVIVIVIVAGVGGVLVFLNNQPATTVVAPTPTPISTPVISTQTQPSLTASSTTPLVVGQPGTVDVYVDTKSIKIDGFQFIATVAGSSLPTIPDSDAVTDGVQIQAATIPELAVSTNTVTAQDGTFVIRFAMIAQDSTKGFSTSGPTKIASIPVSTGTGGSLTLAFNQQNSRVRLSSGGDDSLMGVTDASLDVSSNTVALAPEATPVSTTSSSLVVAAPKTTTTTGSTTSPFCLASCFTDSDCAAGFACETDRCVNPACPTSSTCGCGAAQTATPLVTAKSTATPKATVASTPRPTETPRPTSIASSSATLPASGSFEYTLLTLGMGLLLLGGGVYMTARAEA